MPYTKGEVKQELRFINSLGFKKYSKSELYACKKSAGKVASILANWLNNDSFQGFEVKIITFLDFLSEATLDSPLNDPRPKVFAKIDGREWLVKFKATSDPVNVGEIEYNYSLLAKECEEDTRLLLTKTGEFLETAQHRRAVWLA